MNIYFIRVSVLSAVLAGAFSANAQISLMDVIDSTSKVNISGYIQPQFQVASEKGIASYAGGDFSPKASNRFMLRRGRIRFDYLNNNDNQKSPSVHFVVQLDGTERGVFIRDLWGRISENKWKVLSLTSGMFARPFGFELNHSSSDRESPERGRMSQILMKTERDLGAMATFHPRGKAHPLRWLEIDAGLFNGQGLTAFSEFDGFKDFVSRAIFKPLQGKSLQVSGGLSYYHGSIFQESRYYSEVINRNGKPAFITDSSINNIGRKAPRRYKGADVQLKWKHGKATTEARAEYWRGRQTALAFTSETPTELEAAPLYTRDFDGAFFYLIHRFNDKHQLAVKYDWYDPNTDVSGGMIASTGGFSDADIRYNTLGVGYIYYMNENCKLVLWYDHVKNEKANIAGYDADVDDDVFTCRLQFQF